MNVCGPTEYSSHLLRFYTSCIWQVDPVWRYLLVSEANGSHPCARDRLKKRRRKTHAAAGPRQSVSAVTMATSASNISSSRSTALSTASIAATPSTVSAGSSQTNTGRSLKRTVTSSTSTSGGFCRRPRPPALLVSQVGAPKSETVFRQDKLLTFVILEA